MQEQQAKTQAQAQAQAIQPKAMDFSPTSKVWDEMDDIVRAAGLDGAAQGMRKMVAVANAIGQLSDILGNPAAMRPIMYLQGKGLGFITDKDREGGYPASVVRDCVIEAMLRGVNITNNEFNIIAGRCYVTKNGTMHLLNNLGIAHAETPLIPELSGDMAKCVVRVEWAERDGTHCKQDIAFMIKVSMARSTGQPLPGWIEGVQGKAVRKARMWLYNRISGLDLPYTEDGASASPVDVTPSPVHEEAKSRADEEELLGGREVSVLSDYLGKIGSDLTEDDFKAWCESVHDPFVPERICEDYARLEPYVTKFVAERK